MTASSQYAAFRLRPGTDLMKQRIQSMNADSGILVCGEHKGAVVLNQIFASELDFRLHPLVNTCISKKRVDKIEILRGTKHVVVLSVGLLAVLDPGTLAVKRVLNKSATSFAVSPTDWIAFSFAKKVGFACYKADISDFVPLMFGKHHEVTLSDSVLSVVWNNSIVGATMKKSYVSVAPESGAVTEIAPTAGTPTPNLLVFQDYWVAVSGDSVRLVDQAGKQLPNGQIGIQAKTNPIISMAVKDYYLIVLRETNVGIYNLMDYTKVQDIELEKNDLGRALAIDGERVLIAVDVSADGKKDAFGQIVYLQAISAEEQMKKLLLQCRITEAMKIFSQNCVPADADFEIKKEQFNIEAAWALFIMFDFDKAVEFFLSVNYDPRELLALLPDMLDTKAGDSYTTLKEIVVQKQAERPENVIQEGTKAIIRLLDAKRKYLAEKYELAKEGKRPLQFVYPGQPVNDSFRSAKISVETVVELLDNSLMKLYVEIKDLRMLQTYFDSTKLLKCNYKLMQEYLKRKTESDKSFASHVCQAYLYDKFGNYIQALDQWTALGGEGTTEARELACKETMKLLLTQPVDRDNLFKYARMLQGAVPGIPRQKTWERRSVSHFACPALCGHDKGDPD